MIQTAEKEIAGKQVTVTEFAARRKLRLQYRVMKVLGPLLGSSIGALQGQGQSLMDSTLDGKALGDAVQRAFEVLPEAEFERLVQDILQSTRVDGMLLDKPEAIDAKFTGQAAMSELFKVIAFAWEANFGPLPLARFTSMMQGFQPSGSGETGESSPDSKHGSSE